MLFKDEVIIEIKAGKGGDGSASFHREKFITKGGPDGGDGGDGGHIILKVNPQLRTLSHIHNRQKFKAENGQDGMKNKKFGKKGESVVIEVPPGTQVYEADPETDEETLVHDLIEEDEEFIAAQGGRGGRGNVWFKSSTRQTPFYAEKGKPGETRRIRLELKLIAHVGLVGFPNAGKSTFISKVTNAKPKVANYPFTTLQPNLGVMSLANSVTTVLIADIPGIIEGAHSGKGLGIEFLKHIERTRVILFMLDATDQPIEKFNILREELKNYSETLFNREYLIAVNKIDMIYEKQEMYTILEELEQPNELIFPISAITGDGLKPLKIAIHEKYIHSEEMAEQENLSLEVNSQPENKEEDDEA